MTFIFVLIAIILWTGLGYAINVLNGYLSNKQLIKYYSSQHSMDRDLSLMNYDKTGSVDVSNLELISDALLWPRTLFLAWRGQRRIIEKLKEKQ